MRTMVVRMLAVFAFWGVALAAAVAAGLAERPAELTAAAFSGLTLVVMSLVPARPRTEHRADPVPERPAADERRSAS